MNCQRCGRFVDLPAWEAAKRKFCSRECYTAANIGHPNYNVKPADESTCEVCGKTFLTGGAGRPKRGQRRCSMRCQGLSRYRHGRTSLPLSQSDAAYIAGFLDGEGSIILYMRRDVVAMLVTIANTDKPVLEWLEKVTGVGNVNMHARENATHKTAWFWRCNADAAESLLRQVLPFLKIKHQQAELAIMVQERLQNPALKADRSWQEEYRQRMRALNRRGPALAS